MHECSVVKGIQICKGRISDYNKLSVFHYRDHNIGPYAAIYCLKAKTSAAKTETVGVIVYKTAVGALELRNVATGDIFTGFDRKTRMMLVNKNVRSISRVVIDPRFRGLGLASRLVAETMVDVGVPIVESMAVMGRVNPFFEKAGMRKYFGKEPVRCLQLKEAFSAVGIEEKQLVDSLAVHEKINSLPAGDKDFIEMQTKVFLRSYGNERLLSHCLKRTVFVLGKLTARPVYYIWFNENVELKMQ